MATPARTLLIRPSSLVTRKTKLNISQVAMAAGVPTVKSAPSGSSVQPMPLLDPGMPTPTSVEVPANPVRIEKTHATYTYYVPDEQSKQTILGLLSVSKPSATVPLHIGGQVVEATQFQANLALPGSALMSDLYNQAVASGYAVVVAIAAEAGAAPVFVATRDVAVASFLTTANEASTVVAEPTAGWAPQTDEPLEPVVTQATPEKSNTMLYVGIGVGAVVLVGGIAYLATRKSSRATPNRRRRRH